MSKSWIIVSVIACAVGFAAPASAAEGDAEFSPDVLSPAPVESASSDANAGNRGTITLEVTDITGRLNRPQAAMAISRISTRLTLVSLRQMFLERIEKSIMSGPF